MNTLIARIITGIVLIALVLLGIHYLSPVGYAFMALLIIALAGWEYANICWDVNQRHKIIFFISLLFLSCLTYFLYQRHIVSPQLILGVGAAWWVIAPYFLVDYSRHNNIFFITTLWRVFMGLIIFVPCFFGLIVLREKFGAFYLLYALGLVWAADIGAYFTGLSFGKHLLVPAISPKKTIEGLLGGVAATLLVAVVGGILLKVGGIKWLFVLTLALLTCLWSVIGDLFESMLKRCAGVKDSGKLLPGHGGVYDRIDSLTAAIPIFTLGLLLIG